MQMLQPQIGAFSGHGVNLHNDLQKKAVNLKIFGACVRQPRIQMLHFCPQMYMSPTKLLMLDSAEKLLLLYTRTYQFLFMLTAQ